MAAVKLADHIGLIYVVAPDEGGPCKIGFTANLQKRMTGIQTGCWIPLRPFGVRVAVMMEGGTKYSTMAMGVAKAGQKIERACHALLREMGLGLVGEWFDLSVKDALAVIDKVARMSGARTITMEQVMSVDIDAGLDPDAKRAQAHFARMMGCVTAYIQHMHGDSEIVRWLDSKT